MRLQLTIYTGSNIKILSNLHEPNASEIFQAMQISRVVSILKVLKLSNENLQSKCLSHKIQNTVYYLMSPIDCSATN